MESGKRRRGISILETLLALFIILVALLVTVQLLHSSLRRSLKVQDRVNASLFLQQKLEEIRVRAADPDDFEAGLTAYNNTIHSDPEYPGLQIRSTLADFVPASPSHRLESPYETPAPDSRRLLEESCYRLTLECWWGPSPSERLEATTLLTAPPRLFHPTNPLVISGAPSSPIAQDTESTMSVQAFDENNREIKGLTFKWFVLAKGGNGVIRQTRDGRTGILGHWTFNVDGITKVFSSGTCQVLVQARYNGDTRTAAVEVELQ